MSPSGIPASSLTARLRAWPGIAPWLLIALAAAVLLGWELRIEFLKRVVPGLVAMNPMTALGFLFCAAGLLGMRRPAGARVCALFPIVLGLAVLAQYLFGWGHWTDTLLFPQEALANPIAPTTASSFLLVGLAMALTASSSTWRRQIGQFFAVAALALALLALTGYGYGVESFYRLPRFIAMAVHSALGFVLVGSALLCHHPDEGVMQRLTSARAGGAMLRRLAPYTIAFPLLLGWLILQGMRAGIFEAAFGFTIAVIAVVIFLITMIWWNAGTLDDEDLQRASIEAELRKARAELEATVKERTVELRNAVASIRLELDIVSVAASEILASSSELAASVNETAASVAETTVTMEQVRQAANTTASRAQRVAESARQVAVISAAGTDAVRETAGGAERVRTEMQSIGERMGELSEQTHAIREIVAAVDELAEQSNLLAVNAAIEAAAAREKGKGFAVVAQEMKFLSGQSVQATKQVRTILNDIQRATVAAVSTTEQAAKVVEEGAAQAARAGDSIRELEASVGEAAELAGEIASVSEQQLTGMNQVSLAMEQIRTATVEHTDQVRRLESAARELDALGQRLKNLADRHKA